MGFGLVSLYELDLKALKNATEEIKELKDKLKKRDNKIKKLKQQVNQLEISLMDKYKPPLEKDLHLCDLPFENGGSGYIKAKKSFNSLVEDKN